jgi:DNA repair photolyase
LTRHRDAVDVGFTITTMRDKARILEPLAAHPFTRARAAAKLAAAGVKVWIFLGPVVPGFNDDPQDIAEVVKFAGEIGAELVYDRYRPKPRADAHLAARYRRVETPPRWWGRVKKTIEEMCAKVGVRCRDVEEEWREARRRG